jgi:glycosyltransferase involved in cell wall biosynthesis
MKILMLTPYLPYPPASGGQVRTLNLLKYLSKNNEVTLISLYKNNDEKKYADELKNYCKKVYICKRPTKPWQLDVLLKAILTPRPLLLVRNYSPEATKLIKEILANEQFDVIHTETFYMLPHLPKTTIPVVLVEQTIEYKVYQHFVHTLPALFRPFFYPDLIKLKLWEKYYWKKTDKVATVSEQDRDFIKSRIPTIEPVVIPNGASDDLYVDHLTKKDLSKPSLLFIGNFAWLQNTEAADYLTQNIYPQLKKVLPHIKVIIAGQHAKAKVKANDNKNIVIMGNEPLPDETIKKLYTEATLFVAPLYGPGGTNLKILNSIAAGSPVVTTKVAADRLRLTDNQDVIIADTTEEFVKKIQELLTDEKLYNKIRKNSFDFAKNEYSYESIAKKLEILYSHIRTK